MRELVIEQNGKQVELFCVIDDLNTLIDDRLLDIKCLIMEKIERKKYFYSIEVMPVANAEDLNYNNFSTRPLFTSITWLSDANIAPVNTIDAPAIKLAAIVKHSNAVLSHVTCNRLSEQKLKQILENNIQNVFALRGG